MKKILFAFLFIVLGFGFVTPAFADIYIPQPRDDCRVNEIYTSEKDDYRNIREASFSYPADYHFRRDLRGYCVEIFEYCSKNKCGLLTISKMLYHPMFHVKNIAVNLILNMIIVIILMVVARQNLKKNINISSNILKIFLLTLLGYIIDMIVIFKIFISWYCKGNKYRFHLGVWGLCDYKLSVSGLIYIPLVDYIVLLICVTLIALLVGAAFYFIYSKTLFPNNRVKRIFYSLVFGILSNPIWYILFRIPPI